jgi:hypothetical protein
VTALPGACQGKIESHGVDCGSITDNGRMSVLELIKATVICGVVAFLFYSFPVLGQILMIAVLSLLWLSYARKTILALRRRNLT